MQDPKVSISQIHPLVENATGKRMSHQTIRLALWKHGYHGMNPRKRPFVSGKNPQKRLQFARELVDKEEHFRGKVIWTDETLLKLFDSKRVQTV